MRKTALVLIAIMLISNLPYYDINANGDNIITYNFEHNEYNNTVISVLKQVNYTLSDCYFNNSIVNLNTTIKIYSHNNTDTLYVYNISNTPNNEFGYMIRTKINIDADASGENITFRIILNDNNFQYWDKINDVKYFYVTNETGGNLYFYIDYYNLSSHILYLYVKLPEVVAGDNIIYLVYIDGDTSHLSYSNPDEVFYFFDNITDNTQIIQYGNGKLELNDEYYLTPNYSVAKTTDNDPNGGYIPIGDAVGRDIVLDVFVRRNFGYSGGDYDRVGLIDDNGNGYGGFFSHGSKNFVGVDIRTNYEAEAWYYSTYYEDILDEWYLLSFTVFTSDLITDIYHLDGKLLGSYKYSDTRYNVFKYVYAFGGHDYYIDNIKVYKTINDVYTVNIVDTDYIDSISGCYINILVPDMLVFNSTNSNEYYEEDVNETYHYLYVRLTSGDYTIVNFTSSREMLVPEYYIVYLPLNTSFILNFTVNTDFNITNATVYYYIYDESFNEISNLEQNIDSKNFSMPFTILSTTENIRYIDAIIVTWDDIPLVVDEAVVKIVSTNINVTLDDNICIPYNSSHSVIVNVKATYDGAGLTGRLFISIEPYNISVTDGTGYIGVDTNSVGEFTIQAYYFYYLDNPKINFTVNKTLLYSICKYYKIVGFYENGTPILVYNDIRVNYSYVEIVQSGIIIHVGANNVIEGCTFDIDTMTLFYTTYNTDSYVWTNSLGKPSEVYIDGEKALYGSDWVYNASNKYTTIYVNTSDVNVIWEVTVTGGGGGGYIGFTTSYIDMSRVAFIDGISATILTVIGFVGLLLLYEKRDKRLLILGLLLFVSGLVLMATRSVISDYIYNENGTLKYHYTYNKYSLLYIAPIIVALLLLGIFTLRNIQRNIGVLMRKRRIRY